MDSNALELERGITIYSKNAAIVYKGTKINIVDTPGHADFGCEVERVLRSIDSVLLVVDAQEGPMPQTRFVLKKSLELGLKPIVVINKIDKPAADPARAEEQVLELFLELGASDEQSELSGRVRHRPPRHREEEARRRVAKTSRRSSTPSSRTCRPANATASADAPLVLQPFNLAYDNFLGRLAIVPRLRGHRQSDRRMSSSRSRTAIRAPATSPRSSPSKGSERVEAESVVRGRHRAHRRLAGHLYRRDHHDDADAAPLPAIAIDEPTITLNFLVNNSPFAGREGKFVTSRQIRDRLEKELEVNVGLKHRFRCERHRSTCPAAANCISPSCSRTCAARATRCRSRSRRSSSMKRTARRCEPFEEAIIDTPSEFQGAIIERLGSAQFVLQDLKIARQSACASPLRARRADCSAIATNLFIDTKGEGILSSRFIGFKPYAGEIKKRAGRLDDFDGHRQGARLFALDPPGSRRALYHACHRGL